ncbi:Dephospho-CoA kinase CAB5 [Cladobotryum mycophilum]|uniref:Dephospho-CoA kinase CAB5 n=1 Tax=Cladobotryum mycophilum TaxID=491253 RepID=A0ABR0S9T8_9HYPO
MLLIGLTGSIATGKSTVSSMLSSPPHSLPIIDADVLARKVVEPGTKGYDAIVKHFGPTTPDLLVPASESMPENGPDGKGRPLNRPALGKRVFGDSEELQRDRAVLNGIVHPAVLRGDDGGLRDGAGDAAAEADGPGRAPEQGGRGEQGAEPGGRAGQGEEVRGEGRGGAAERRDEGGPGEAAWGADGQAEEAEPGLVVVGCAWCAAVGGDVGGVEVLEECEGE